MRLRKSDKKAIIAFLKTLTDYKYVKSKMNYR
jgi:hypothetical protein